MKSSGFIAYIDGWMFIEIVLFVLYSVYVILCIEWCYFDRYVIPWQVWTYLRIPLLIFVWLALNRPLLHLQGLGPFIQILGQTVVSTGQFAFLFIEFLVPFVCGIWITFGRPHGKFQLITL